MDSELGHQYVCLSPKEGGWGFILRHFLNERERKDGREGSKELDETPDLVTC